MEANDPTQAWKQKYLDSLDELEAKEAYWADMEQVLRQGLARLSLAAHRSDDELNTLLDELRKRLRNQDDTAELKTLLEQLAEPICRLDEARQDCQDSQPHHPSELLLQLLDQLKIPAELQAQADKIRTLLDDSDSPQPIEPVISAMADLVHEMRQQVMEEKLEIERFLGQLTERLREIDEGFQASLNNQRHAYEGGRQLDEQVQAQVSGIEQSVTEAQDLSGLKKTLAIRIDTIRSHMQQFRQDQDQQLEAAEKQIHQLNQQVMHLQQKSDQLHTRIKQQRDLALTDPLTGLPNRLAYNDRIALEHARWKRYGHDLVLAVWDVDRFKQINDTYGHQAGDKALKVIGRLLQSQVRETDFVARFGGEEFLLVMPETALERARVLVEQLRAAVEACEFHFRGKRVPITISCGMTAFQADDTPEQVFDRADAALYRAKKNGRNQCVSA